MSLYEDLVAAWVPAKHEWLKGRPLGEELINRLGKQKLFTYCDCMLFNSHRALQIHNHAIFFLLLLLLYIYILMLKVQIQVFHSFGFQLSIT